MLKIGVFDSGLGGLTVVKSLSQIIKNAELFYIADTKNAPYGEKTPKQILQYSLDITKYFTVKHDIDVLILACNTATAFAIKQLRELYPDLIIIGTEPGVKPAIEQTQTGKIGILATPATLKGEKYQELVNVLAQEKDVQLFEQSCSGLVEQIEKGEISTAKTRKLLENWILPMKENSVDIIVLGCTHYPLVADTISEIMISDVLLIDTGMAIANRLLDLSLKQGHHNKGTLLISLATTGDIQSILAEKILQLPINIKNINISNI